MFRALTLCDQNRISCFTVPLLSPHLLQHPKASHHFSFHRWNMAVQFDLGSLPDLICSLALRPLVHGAAGDKKHDPIRKIYVWSALGCSVLDRSYAFTVSSPWLFCLTLKAAQAWRFCSTDSDIKKVPCRWTACFYFVSFFPQPRIGNPSCTNFFNAFCLSMLVYMKRTFIYLRVNAAYFQYSVWFLYYCRLVFAGNASSCGWLS